MKLNVKPVYVHLVHRSAYMGPCRGGTWEQLERSYDEMMAAENFAKMKEGLEKVYGGEKDICLQEPVYLEFLDEFVVRESHFEKVKDEDTDVFLLDGMMGQHLAVNIAKRYRKPMVTVGCCTSTDTTACLRAAGFEGYGSIDLEGTKPILKTLLAKKAIANTRVLSILKGDICSKGVESNIRDFDRLTNQWGIGFKFLNAEDFLQEISGLDAQELERAGGLADELMAQAEDCSISREMLVNSTKVYVATKKLLERYECNAFTLPCFEICATGRINKEKYTWCLTHSLLKEEGIPSACESDYNALLSMIVVMAVAGNAPHMANTHPALSYEIPQDVPNTGNLIKLYHAVPTRYMKGRDSQPAPFGLHCFTEDRWGATMRYHYNRDIGQTVTMVRFNPQGTGLLAARGVITCETGYDKIGCDTGLLVDVENKRKFFKAQCNYGHHMTWAYGDIAEQLEDLGETMGFSVERV